VEVLYLAMHLGYYCTDMPVTWRNDSQSRVQLIRDSWLMFKDLMQIRKMHANDQPVYYKKKIPI
jgi:dolichyl-phosphate beta-glucosyltransferase